LFKGTPRAVPDNHVDCGAAFHNLDALVQELVSHGTQPVLQPPVVGPQGLYESVEGFVLAPVPVELGA
jgi:hypothetical protein